MRFCQNVLRMTWKERFVDFWWKAHYFSVLKRIWGQCDDFENFDAPKCDLGKTCSAWPKKSVLYNFQKAHCFSVLKTIWGQFHDFENFVAQKWKLAKTCSAWPEKSVLYNFHEKPTVFPFWRQFEASVTILKTLRLQNAIWPKRAAHDLKRAFCTLFIESALFSRFQQNFKPAWQFWKLWRSKMRFGGIVLRMTWKVRFVQFSMKSALFSRFEENLRPLSRFWELWRSEMRFGQNVLRMTWKERFVDFWWKAHYFSVLKRIWGQCDDFENFDAPKCDLGKTCSAWHEKSVLYNFQKAHCFSVLKRIWGQFHDFENFVAQKWKLAKTCSAWPEKSVLYNFHEKPTVFPFWRQFEASFTILRTLTLQNAIWPKRAAHDLKSAFCTIFMTSALFSRFKEILRPLSRLWELWRSKMRFGQNVLRMTWKERFVQFLWRAHSFPVLRRIRGHDDFENFDDPKCDLAETCCAWPEMCVLYTFYRKRTVSRFEENLKPVWRFWELWRSKLRFGEKKLRMTWKERFVQFSWRAHCFPVLKRILCQCDDFENFDARKCDLAETCSATPEKSVLYNFHGKRTVFLCWRELEAMTILKTLTIQNAIWPKRAAHDLKCVFCTLFIESALFSRFEENLKPVWRFWELWRSKLRFGEKKLRMTWKERFVQFSWRAHCFPFLKRIWGQCDGFENYDARKCDLGKTCPAWPEKSVFVQFSWKANCFSVLKRIWGQFHDFENFAAPKCDLGKTCSAWPEKSVLYSFHRKRTVFPFWAEFKARMTILKTLTLQNAIWPKRAAHNLKWAFCTILM